MKLSKRIKEKFYGKDLKSFKTSYMPSSHYTIEVYRKVSNNCNFVTGEIEIQSNADEWIIEYTTIDDEDTIRNIPKSYAAYY